MKPRSGTATLPEDVGMYLDTIRKRFSGIDAVWLLAVDTDRPAGMWRLLVFASAGILAAMRNDPVLPRDDVEFLIVTDGDRLESVWGDKAPASLAAMHWRLDAPDAASYREAAAKRKRATAVRVR